ncbi:PREDICTED: protein AF-9-like [Amphimedon queenslandica]|uniref:YEATS domain-containing protein n=1 Tax=Amphimedon queenslandica TaxID=400682 RepID=A0A1X7UU86_AMPQE|nr:PREDICTED: protein AF-9-like [Amphimedon queenslandica]|eukprot:XP_003386748.1 PREDICTED: protein AF-9-like [Amphimedon queenslandica]
MSQAIQIKLVLGHSAQWRKKPTQEGYTHDWTILVRGEDGQEIRHFVEKVIFFLHESFAKPKRVIKEPPYQVSESGYGSFNLPIEVYFRNKDEPKKVRFEYDLLLPNLNDPPINQIRSECLTFQNPSEEFKSKLLKAGGVITGGGPGNSSIPPSSQKVKRPLDDGDLSHKKPLKMKKVKKGGDSSGSDTSSDSESDDQPPSAPVSKSTKSGQSKKSSPNTWDTAALKRLHKHLNSLQDPQRLQEIVNIIEQTGQYNLTQSTFDFDLCKLDDHTLSKLSKFMDAGGIS